MFRVIERGIIVMKFTHVFQIAFLFVFPFAFPFALLFPVGAQEQGAKLDYDHLENACVAVLLNGQLAGSGSFVNATGTVLTAAHVISTPGQKVEVMSKSVGRLLAEVVAMDLGNDLALLQVDVASPAFLRLAKEVPKPTQRVYCYGAPLFRYGVLLEASVAGAEPGFEYMMGGYVRCMYLSGLAAKGTSGGAWINRAGRIVGVENGQMAVAEVPQGVIFMTPVEGVRRLVETREYASTVDLRSGLDELWEHAPAMRKKVGVEEGLMARFIKEDSPLKKAGVPEEAVIMALDGEPVSWRVDFLRVLKKKAPGDVVRLTIKEAGKDAREVEVTLTRAEAAWVAEE